MTKRPLPKIEVFEDDQSNQPGRNQQQTPRA
jgi:hypothetical protein